MEGSSKDQADQVGLHCLQSADQVPSVLTVEIMHVAEKGKRQLAVQLHPSAYLTDVHLLLSDVIVIPLAILRKN